MLLKSMTHLRQRQLSNIRASYSTIVVHDIDIHSRLHPHLVQTLSKWSSKIQAVAPSVLLPSNRGAFSNRSAQSLKSAVQLVDETLHGADYDKVLARTRVHRGKGSRIGTEPTAETADEDMDVDVEIFDDTDFYQQLLRDIIDSRGNRVGDAEDWTVVQKQKKAKKKVDTKASKGRKLRRVLESSFGSSTPLIRSIYHQLRST